MSNRAISKFLTVFGNIKIFPYPFFVIYDPKSYRVTAKETREIENILQNGDILLRCYINYLDGYFIPSKFSHAAIATESKTVVHAVAEGVKEEDILQFCRCDGVVVLRPRVSYNDKVQAVEYARAHIGCSYDFEFNPDTEDTYFCTELVYWCYKGKINVEPHIVTKLFGLLKKYTIVPDEYLNNLKLDIVYATELAQKRLKK